MKGQIRMSVKFDVRSIESPEAAEIYISATPQTDAPLEELAKEIFTRIAETLRLKKAHILQERLYGTPEGLKVLSEERSAALADIDDGVAPSLLVVNEAGSTGPIAGVQVHAVVCDAVPEVIRMNGVGCGRIVRVGDKSCLTLSGIGADVTAGPAQQAQSMLAQAEAILKQCGLDMLAVPRTWMWLGDILGWYEEFNDVRNRFFTECGILGDGGRQLMPASTGIGLAPSGGGMCAMDLMAVEPADSIKYLQAVGKQHCAFEYGSAFSRASRAMTPAGETVFVSGTASIDMSGATTNIGNPAGQIDETIENVRAALADMGCGDEDLVLTTAYCKNREVEGLFEAVKEKLNWPWVTVVCDICRSDLLFEIEATAGKAKI